MAQSMMPPPDFISSKMVLPSSKKTFFNTKWTPGKSPLCAYDKVFHPPDYDPKASRSDRREPYLARRNIWDQEKTKLVPSTWHHWLGRPTLPIIDRADKKHGIVVVQNQNPHMDLADVLQWATLLESGKAVCTNA